MADRPFRSLCPEADYRDTLTDAEFWEAVYHQDDGPDLPHDGPDGPDTPLSYPTPCPMCGELGACAYDAEGRPLIHAQDDEGTSDG